MEKDSTNFPPLFKIILYHAFLRMVAMRLQYKLTEFGKHLKKTHRKNQQYEQLLISFVFTFQPPLLFVTMPCLVFLIYNHAFIVFDCRVVKSLDPTGYTRFKAFRFLFCSCLSLSLLLLFPISIKLTAPGPQQIKL